MPVPDLFQTLAFAHGGRAMTMTCAAIVQAMGKGFHGQLGIDNDRRVEGRAQFLAPALNTRSDHYGGSLEGRSRLLFEVTDGIRTSCRPDFQLGLKLSMERFGLRVGEIRDVAAEAIHTASVDYLDIAPHDIAETTDDLEFKGRTLLGVFTGLPRGQVKLGASAKIMSARKAATALEAGCHFVLIGRAAILQPDFPQRIQANHDHHSLNLPVSQSHRENAGLSLAFINYLPSRAKARFLIPIGGRGYGSPEFRLIVGSSPAQGTTWL